MSKKIVFILPLLLLSPFHSHAAWSFTEKYTREQLVSYLPYIGFFSAGALLSGAVLEAYHWWATQKESEDQICIRAKQLIQEINNENHLVRKLHFIVNNESLSLEEQLQKLYTLYRSQKIPNNYHELIESYLKQAREIQHKLTTYKLKHEQRNETCANLDTLIEENQRIFEYLQEVGFFILKHQSFFKAKKELSNADKLLQSNASSAQLMHIINQLSKLLIEVREYPNLHHEVENAQSQLQQAYQAVELKEREAKVKELSLQAEKIMRVFDQELHQPLSIEMIEKCVSSYQIKNHAKYRYLQYAQGLEEAIARIASCMQAMQETDLSHNYRLDEGLDRLKIVQQFMQNDVRFMRYYNDDLEMQRRDNLEAERVNALKQRLAFEEKARQEQLNLERQRVRLEREKVDMNLARIAFEQCKQAEGRRKARAIEEQNRLERQKLAQQSVQQYQPKIDPPNSNYPDLYPNVYPDASAPPMD